MSGPSSNTFRNSSVLPAGARLTSHGSSAGSCLSSITSRALNVRMSASLIVELTPPASSNSAIVRVVTLPADIWMLRSNHSLRFSTPASPASVRALRIRLRTALGWVAAIARKLQWTWSSVRSSRVSRSRACSAGLAPGGGSSSIP